MQPLLLLFAQTTTGSDLLPANPTSTGIMGSIIAALLAAVGLLGWVVKWLFGHLDKVSELTAAVARLGDAVKAVEANIDEKATKAITEGFGDRLDRLVDRFDGAMSEERAARERQANAEREARHALAAMAQTSLAGHGNAILQRLDALDK